MITILDVIDNFLTTQTPDHRTFARMPGSAIVRFGEEVQRFARDYVPPAPKPELHPVYLGGWPSANFWDGYNGNLAMSALLYAGQLLAKDPISDWFSIEQYSIPTLMAARPGYLHRPDGTFNIANTRVFLSHVVPGLLRLRPLIESGVIVLVPSKSFCANHYLDIQKVSAEVADAIGQSATDFTARFSPRELAVEDNVRGTFIFAGGNREQQIREAIDSSAKYFVAEQMLAAEHGFCYTAPFRYERHLCEFGIGRGARSMPGARVVDSILRSRLGIFKGLTPEFIASLRDDENFNLFRSALYQVYRDVPENGTDREIAEYLQQTEAALVGPQLLSIARESTTGVFPKMGVELSQAVVRFGATFLLAGAFLQDPDPKTVAVTAGISTVAAFCASIVKKRPSGPRILWKSLLDHQATVRDEVPKSIDVEPQGSAQETKGLLWGIPEKPSLQITVSSGILIMDTVREPDAAERELKFDGSTQNPYGLCPCRSGLKYRFCCRGLERKRK